MTEQFRRRCELVDAEQFHADHTWPEGVTPAKLQMNRPQDGLHGRVYWPVGAPILHTPKATLVSQGDWIVTSKHGERSVWSDDTFQATYEPVAQLGVTL